MLDRTCNDICFSCKHVESCAFRKTLGSESHLKYVIFECGEFEVEPSEEKSRDVAPPRSASIHPAGNGLCDDCGNRVDCALSRVEGGIWHCEEYE